MSSRLFREIRETRGLAYAVHSFRLPFQDAGATAVYVGTTPNQTAEVLDLVRAELDKLMEHGITDEELGNPTDDLDSQLTRDIGREQTP